MTSFLYNLTIVALFRPLALLFKLALDTHLKVINSSHFQILSTHDKSISAQNTLTHIILTPEVWYGSHTVYNKIKVVVRLEGYSLNSK